MTNSHNDVTVFGRHSLGAGLFAGVTTFIDEDEMELPEAEPQYVDRAGVRPARAPWPTRPDRAAGSLPA